MKFINYFIAIVVTCLAFYVAPVNAAHIKALTRCTSLNSLGINMLSDEIFPEPYRPTTPRCPSLNNNEECYAAQNARDGDLLIIIETSAKNSKDALMKINNSDIFSAKTHGNPYSKQGCHVIVDNISLRMWHSQYDMDITTDAEREATTRDVNDWPEVKAMIFRT